ncbi:Tripartite motif-containing protein 14 [Apodemus speciosus]|uniref:Tripartite motif-containing protein 14 n=1 Tax=Apodemus speciosus TaxID=105296 RepID=A0ABQ0EN77_APOSI
MKQIQDCLQCLATKKRQHTDNIAQLEDAGERLKVYADESKAWLTQKFTELRLLLDEEEALAKKFIDKNTQLALQVYREQAESCGKRIEVMDDFSSRVWGISREPHPVQLLQAYVATKSEMGQQMSPSELSHPVPLSFEPVKNFFKEFVDAIRNTFQKPMDIRLKERPALVTCLGLYEVDTRAPPQHSRCLEGSTQWGSGPALEVPTKPVANQVPRGRRH